MRRSAAVPITHTPSSDPADAAEIPSALKAHIGLDDLPSRIVVTETNDFLWPAPRSAGPAEASTVRLRHAAAPLLRWVGRHGA